MDQPPSELTVIITGAAGNLSYQLLPTLCSGEFFGPNTSINLNLLDLDQCIGILKAIQSELEDCGFKLLKEIRIGTSAAELFKDADVAIFLGGFPRKPGMERVDLLQINGAIFKYHGQMLNTYGKKTCKSLVVANPVNTNCLILQENCPNIPKENFTALTNLGVKRAKNLLARHLDVNYDDIKNIIVWGNHSTTLYPDVKYARVKGELIEYQKDREFYEGEFIHKVQKRGAEVLSLKRASPVLTGAIAIRSHFNKWFQGTNEGEYSCMGVITDGTTYDIPAGLCFSLPVVCRNFNIEVIKDLELDEFSRERIKATTLELLKEKEIAKSLEDFSN